MSKPHGNSYPWTDWFAVARKSNVLLKKGRHYNITTIGMVVNIRQAARRHGLAVSLSVSDTSITIKSVKRRRAKT